MVSSHWLNVTDVTAASATGLVVQSSGANGVFTRALRDAFDVGLIALEMTQDAVGARRRFVADPSMHVSGQRHVQLLVVDEQHPLLVQATRD
jgi:hypothetical protein